jgi:hypothetical protein
VKTEDLITQLSGSLAAAPRLWPLRWVTGWWIAGSLVYVCTLTWLLGPFRPGVAEQLSSHPRFALEMALGFGTLVCMAIAAFRDAVPGLDSRLPRRIGWILAAGWLGNILAGYVAPMLEPSMLGKREHCALEAYLCSLPPTLVAIWLQRRRFPLEPRRSATQAALAAGMMPAVLMQVACMYEPSHILEGHVLPVGVIALATWIGCRIGCRSLTFNLFGWRFPR